ncbi:MAG TPA: Hsp33 family molecular chaperone HslO [Thermoanaerobaculia bacterium]|nr:Hsp33 family molecular chaperone HslO [Thermoanaerobaculia bacterium]
MEDRDRLIQGMAWSGDFRVIAAQTTVAAEEARIRMDLSPVAAAAAARGMTGAVLLARLLDKDVPYQRVTLRFDGGGPLGLLVAEGTVKGEVRAFVANPHVDDDSRVDVGSAIGSNGKLTVVRAIPPEGTPWTSQVALVSGEIARDLAHYLDHSEQIASAIMLGQVVRPAGIEAAGGLVVQAFPHTTPAAIERMEERIRNAPPLSTLLDRMKLEDAVQEVLKGSDYKTIDPSFDVPIRFSCSCSRERALYQLQFLSPSDISELLAKGEGAEVVCQFCGTAYQISDDELLALSPAADA